MSGRHARGSPEPVGVTLFNYHPKPSYMGPARCIFAIFVFPTHFETLSGCIRGQEFFDVSPKKSFNNLKDLIARCFSPNKRSEEGFLLSLYRITFVDQDLLSWLVAHLPRLA